MKKNGSHFVSVIPAGAVGTVGQLPTAQEQEPVRIALEGGGIGRVIFSGSATPDDIEALIDVLKIQQRQMRKQRMPESTN